MSKVAISLKCLLSLYSFPHPLLKKYENKDDANIFYTSYYH